MIEKTIFIVKPIYVNVNDGSKIDISKLKFDKKKMNKLIYEEKMKPPPTFQHPALTSKSATRAPKMNLLRKRKEKKVKRFRKASPEMPNTMEYNNSIERRSDGENSLYS